MYAIHFDKTNCGAARFFFYGRASQFRRGRLPRRLCRLGHPYADVERVH
jgi:hypothetical protein